MLIIQSDKQRPATAKLSFDLFQQSGALPGQWAQIYTDPSHCYYASVWPAPIPDQQIWVSPFVQMNRLTDFMTPCIRLVTKPTIAIRVQVSYQLTEQMSHQDQLAHFGFVFTEASESTQLKYIQHQLVHQLIHRGARVQSVLQLNIVSTYPADTHVLVSPATLLSLHTTSSDILTETMAAISVDDSVAVSSFQRAYRALYEVVCFPFLYKQWIEQLQIECPKGVLLYGPPGVGKTFLVSCLAKQYGAKMFVIQGSDLFGPMVGESEERLRSQFSEAKMYAIESPDQPVILFIDEMDALTPKRDQSQSHENRMVAQLLTLMDGVESRGKLVVVGATNRPNAIDPALRRPGRFDREIHMEAPNANDRLALFQSQVNQMPLDATVDLDRLASMTNGYVAADIHAVCREAAMAAVRRAMQQQEQESVQVTLADFRSAFTSVGPSMQRGFQVQVDKMTWEDVGGLEQVKKRLQQAVEWPLLYKDSFQRLGLKPPRGILLYGPPGCSKTTLVKVIASSANIAFLSIHGAQLYSPFVGDSEKVIRSTFQKARASAPAIIFLDETEAIVGKRNMGHGGSDSGDSVQERVLSTLLNEMDGVENAEAVLVVGATNRPDMLDAALMRPGRFDQAVYVPPPDQVARLAILKIHTRHMPLSSDVNLESISKRTPYYTGADLQNLCREAAMVALRSLNTVVDVTMTDFDKALSIIPASLNEALVKKYSKNPHGSNEEQ